MKKGLAILVALLVLITIFNLISYAWEDDSGPWGRRGHHRGGNRRGVTEPIAITLVGIGLIGLGIYAYKKHKKS